MKTYSVLRLVREQKILNQFGKPFISRNGLVRVLKIMGYKAGHNQYGNLEYMIPEHDIEKINQFVKTQYEQQQQKKNNAYHGRTSRTVES